MRAKAVAPLNEPIRCLVIQLGGLDETLQGMMALRAAKQLYPSLEIHFIARKDSVDAARRVPWIENVIALDSEDILRPVLDGQKTEVEALREIARWLAPLINKTQKNSWDLIVNWSYSDASSYLTGLIPARVKLGYTRRKDASFGAADGWSHYIQAVVKGDVRQNVHLTDILTTQLLTALQIHFGEPANEGNAPVTSKSFFSLELGPEMQDELGWCWRDYSRKWVAIQLSIPTNVWSMQSWIALTQMVLRRNPDYSVVLLGGEKDETRARELIAAIPTEDQGRLLSLVGKTDFDLWASVLSGCQWLFAENAAAIHLASVLGTRVMSITPTPSLFSQRGPYGNGHYTVARAKGSEEAIPPQGVYAAWTYAVHEWAHRRQYDMETHFEKLGWKTEAALVQVYRSKIRGTHDGGGVVFEPQITRPAALEDWFSMVMGHMARAWYCGWVPPVGQELTRERISPALVKILRELDETTQVMTQIYGESILTSLAINRKSTKLKSAKLMQVSDRDEITNLGKKLLELDSLVERLVAAQPSLKAFSQMAKVLMHNLKSDQLTTLGRESAGAYRQLNDGVAILRDWLSHTLTLARPKAVTLETRGENNKARRTEVEL
jgi:ADP-heptose:LPS heptosyltransferase